MHRRSGPVRRHDLLAAGGLVLLCSGILAGCSVAPSSDPSSTEVAGVVLERGEDADAEQAEPGRADADVAADEAPAALELLRSGPARVGTIWLAAEGQWVGLDGQAMELGADDPVDIRLDALVEAEGASAAADLTACEVRIRAPEAADLQGLGELSLEVVIEQQDGEVVRRALESLQLDVDLAPGQSVELLATTPDGSAVALDVDRDAQVRCEGRFDRT